MVVGMCPVPLLPEVGHRGRTLVPGCEGLCILKHLREKIQSIHKCPWLAWQAYVSAHVAMCLCVWIGNVEEEDRTALVEKAEGLGWGCVYLSKLVRIPLRRSEQRLCQCAERG